MKPPPFTPDGRPIAPAKIKSSEIVSELYRYQSKHPITIHEKMAFLNCYVTADFVTVTIASRRAASDLSLGFVMLLCSPVVGCT